MPVFKSLYKGGFLLSSRYSEKMVLRRKSDSLGNIGRDNRDQGPV